MTNVKKEFLKEENKRKIKNPKENGYDEVWTQSLKNSIQGWIPKQRRKINFRY